MCLLSSGPQRDPESGNAVKEPYLPRHWQRAHARQDCPTAGQVILIDDAPCWQLSVAIQGAATGAVAGPMWAGVRTSQL